MEVRGDRPNRPGGDCLAVDLSSPTMNLAL
jgi:hypothetical protein